jgi:hypothetical protein
MRGLRTIALMLALLPNAYVLTMSVVWLGLDQLPLMLLWAGPSLLALVSILATLRQRRWGLPGYLSMTVVQLVACFLGDAIGRGVLLALPFAGVVAFWRRSTSR